MICIVNADDIFDMYNITCGNGFVKNMLRIFMYKELQRGGFMVMMGVLYTMDEREITNEITREITLQHHKCDTS